MLDFQRLRAVLSHFIVSLCVLLKIVPVNLIF